GELWAAAPTVAAALREIALAPAAFEWAVCDRSLSETLRAHPTAAALNGRQVGDLLGEPESAHAAWRRANATHTLEPARARFVESVRRAAASAAGLPAADKAWKREYAAGRRDLEHEMGKVMRFKSIRELMTGPTGPVIRDLKPVWLMSPLSVADTLPL